MLSNSSKYALKAVLFLALHTDENNKMMVKDISARTNVPKAYIAKLLQELSKRNIISSTGKVCLGQFAVAGTAVEFAKCKSSTPFQAGRRNTKPSRAAFANASTMVLPNSAAWASFH